MPTAEGFSTTFVHASCKSRKCSVVPELSPFVLVVINLINTCVFIYVGSDLACREIFELKRKQLQ